MFFFYRGWRNIRLVTFSGYSGIDKKREISVFGIESGGGVYWGMQRYIVDIRICGYHELSTGLRPRR